VARSLLVAVILGIGGCLAGEADAQLEAGDPTDRFELSRWLGNVGGVTDIAFVSDGRAVVTRKGGEIAVVMPDGSVQSSSASIDVDSESEKGLLGVVADERDNLYFYASTGNDDRDKHKVYRGTLDASGAVSVDLSRSIIGGGLEGPANHDGGGMVIHEGLLYVGVGDTGFNASPPTNKYGTCLNKANAKILRVGLDGSIPADNPLVSVAMATGCDSPRGQFAMLPPDKRIYAWGLRNPWRFWIDPATDLLWIGDVGEVDREEITVGGKGAHHGWPFHEGDVAHGELGGIDGCMQVQPAGACIPPQHAYGRGDGVSVTGGLIPPAGCGWGAYEQRYFFADYGTGRVWTLDVKPDRSGAVANSRKPFARIDSVVSFRTGPDGAMYIASHDGSIQRVAPRNAPATCEAAAEPTPGPTPTPTPTPTADAAAQDGAAAPGAASGASDGDGGCDCRVSSRRSHGPAALAVGAVLIALLRTVRRRRP
jgi:glucose/arabinose dehydrogenase